MSWDLSSRKILYLQLLSLVCVYLKSSNIYSLKEHLARNMVSPSVVPQSVYFLQYEYKKAVHVCIKGIEAEEWNNQVREVTLQS